MTVQKIENSHIATKNAYDAVIYFDGLQFHEQNQQAVDTKNDAIQVYKNNQMSNILNHAFSNGSLNIFVIYLLIKQ